MSGGWAGGGWAGGVILGIWLTWLAIWVLMAFGTKRTVERGLDKRSLRWLVVFYALVIALVVSIHPLTGGHPFAGVVGKGRLWSPDLVPSVIAVAIVFAGASFAVWARVILGRNWSMDVTFKEGHELIERGPYALARHPIYTGLLAMALGTAVSNGHGWAFVACVGLGVGLFIKLRMEEKMMTRHFPEAYADYRRRVRALIPFVL